MVTIRASERAKAGRRAGGSTSGAVLLGRSLEAEISRTCVTKSPGQLIRRGCQYVARRGPGMLRKGRRRVSAGLRAAPCTARGYAGAEEGERATSAAAGETLLAKSLVCWVARSGRACKRRMRLGVASCSDGMCCPRPGRLAVAGDDALRFTGSGTLGAAVRLVVGATTGSTSSRCQSFDAQRITARSEPSLIRLLECGRGRRHLFSPAGHGPVAQLPPGGQRGGQPPLQLRCNRGL